MEELLKLINNSSLFTDDKCFDSLDLTTKEGYDKAIKVLNDVSENELINTIAGNWLSIDMKGLVDNLKSKVDKIYNDANPPVTVQPVEETCKKQPCSCHRKLTDKSVEAPERPSESVTVKVSKQIRELTAEYMCKVVAPNSNATKQQLENIEDGLYEFACWLMNHK